MANQKIKLYQYYQKADFNPVFVDLKKKEAVDNLDGLRRKVFEYNLRLPVGLFRGARIIEFGPASGENSLIMAKWGGKLCLVEPVESFISTLRENFSRHGLQGQLERVVCSPMEDYKSKERYDIVLAEGFVFRLGHPSKWIPLLLSSMNEDGYLIFSHLETAGYLIDTLHAKVFQYVLSFTGEEPELLAQQLYRKKWDRVSHVRSFSSWVGDNLRNPLIGEDTDAFIDLQKIMSQQGVDLWSSWPSIAPNDLTWVKAPIDRKKILTDSMRAYYEMVPGMILGERVEAGKNSLEHGPLMLGSLKKEMRLLGGVKGSSSGKHFDGLMDAHGRTEDILARSVLSYRGSPLKELWSEIGQCYDALKRQDKGKIVRLFNGNGRLARSWGSPNFYSAWHRFN